jgi:hypothetical protein
VVLTAAQITTLTPLATVAANTTEVRPPTSAVTSVASSATTVTLKASNANRRNLSVYNDADKAVYIKHGATASASSFTVKVAAGGFYELPNPCYSGVVDAIWLAAPTGNALITETT